MALSWLLGMLPRRPTDHRTGLGRGTAGRLHAGLRVFADQTARPHDCAAGIVLGRRLDRRRHDRLRRRSRNTGDWGWRWALAIGALPLLYAIVTRVHIPESVRFLEAKGREDEAEKAVRYFEEAGGVAPVTSPKGKPLPKIKTRRTNCSAPGTWPAPSPSGPRGSS